MSIVNLVKPNLLATKDCRDYISYYANIKLSNIANETLKSDLLAVAKYQTGVDQSVNDIVRSSIDLMNSDDIQNVLNDYDLAPEYKNDLKTIIEQRKKDFLALRNTLQKKTYNLDTMSYTSNQYRLDELRLTLKNLQDVAIKDKSTPHYDQLLTARYELDVSIDAIQNQSTLDKLAPILNQVIKTAQDVLDKPADFKKKLIDQGLTIAASALKLYQEQVRLENMISARSNIIGQLNNRELRADDIDRQIKACVNEINDIKEYESIPTIKKQYVDEANKILTSFDSFIAVVFSNEDPKESASSFLMYAPAFHAYTDTLFREWLRG
ncbi:hypothetical protein DJ564_30355 [Pseudomonas sp. 31-12]|uniref:hypothetical protein n=1 Tax=Pseudomonas sp. 31-12 TaxID=2201356 RepID=UPI000D6C8652|nr:hypothetical protein [Pseudomonas sp. 31-12]AWM94780.1 hypothetical protein DJ564_30355 [Pseudomonas sp. 31-12]